ncbi:hypothetical protein WJX74_001334 [Apatococcus lobatus]|uniref:Acyl-coenzyme A oxidase n=2 Tax=Apatococcus TaxID=904362 RepID=A0AAW1T0R7_9CHLO
MVREHCDRTTALVNESSQLVLAGHVEPQDDLRAERKRASFSSQELAVVLNGGTEVLQRRSRLISQLQSTSWGSQAAVSQRCFHSREQLHVEGLVAQTEIWKLMQSGALSQQDAKDMETLLTLPGGLTLHQYMFIPTIETQGDEEQQAYWLPKARALEITGAYAQTEMGHGTFVRGLETTATYDRASEEFIIHSPALSSIKWWPGGLGKTATHCIMLARLIINSKDHGLHPFVMQIRDLHTHLPLAGVRVGDIGPKFGYNGVDNGYLMLDRVRIPRRAMLMRHARVTPDGHYFPPSAENAKATYGTMVAIRALLVDEAGWVLARATTIAVRYTAIRRQTSERVGDKELQVLDYQNLAATLLPLVASAYALIFMGKASSDMYKRFEQDRDAGNLASLPELHVLLAGMKALSTWTAADGIEACRRGCGGHGYSALSGLPDLYASYVQNVTLEGDNNVMSLQTARHLVKSQEAVAKGRRVEGSAAYLQRAEQELHRKCSVQAPQDWQTAEVLDAALRHRATYLAAEGHKLLLRHGGGKINFAGPDWNGNTVQLIHMAQAHSQLVLHTTFAQSVHQADLEPAARAALIKLVALHGMSLLLRDLQDLFMDGYLQAFQAQMLVQRRNELLLELRPDAVALVDSFGIADYQLNSCLGRSDGDVYRALLEAASGQQLNKTEEGPAWNAVLKPWLDPASRQQARSKL